MKASDTTFSDIIRTTLYFIVMYRVQAVPRDENFGRFSQQPRYVAESIWNDNFAAHQC